jgi:hypothetical protein
MELELQLVEEMEEMEKYHPKDQEVVVLFMEEEEVDHIDPRLPVVL